MKTELRTIEKYSSLPFPKLMINEDKGIIIFAVREEGDKLSGTCLDEGESPNTKGYYTENWIKSSFKDLPLNVELVLSNTKK